MSIPSLMRAVPTPSAAGAEQLKIEEVPVPQPGPQEVLIKVAAAGINRPDILQRDGLYPAPKGHSNILGLEVAGVVVACGEGVETVAVGEEVCALVNGGGYAEYVIAHQGALLPIADGLTLTEASGLPETVLTVWHNVFQRAGLQAGEWFMVHGGASGIGTTAIQLAHAFGAKVIATAGSDTKCEICRLLGADFAINYNNDDFAEVAKELTDGRGVNVILDMVGGDYIERNFSTAAMDGRIVQIAFLKGAKVEVNFMRLMLKRLTLTGSTLRARDNAFKAALTEEVKKHVWPLFPTKQLKPQIDRVFDFSEIVDAHKLMESGAHVGKIILKME